MPDSAPRINKRLIFIIAGVAATGGLLFGFDTGVISGALLFLKKDFALSAQGQEWVVSAVLLGCIVGAAASGRMVDIFGRKTSIIVTACVFAAGSVWTGTASSIPMLIAGRMVIGLAIGVASYAVPLYLSEIAPPEHRGALVSLNQLLITVGIVASYLVDDVFASSDHTWRLMFLTGTFPALILGIGMAFLPQTPQWLTSRGCKEDAAAILKRLMPGTDATAELESIEKNRQNNQSGSLRDLTTPWVRPALLIGVGIMLIQQATGINTVIYYAPTIFQMAGFNSATTAITATVGVGLINVLMTVVSIRLVDRLGRKPLLSAGLIGMTICLAGLALGFRFEAAMGSHLKWLTVALLFVYIGSFAVSLGPIAWLLIAEIYPLQIRGVAMSMATLSNWVFNFIISVSFLSLTDSLGKSGAFSLYAVVGVLGWFFCRWYVPETKGVPLETIEMNLRAGVPAKDLGQAS